MIVINIHWLVRLLGCKHPYSYLRNHGFSAMEARGLLSGKARLVRLDMVARLMVVFRCEPTDLLDWIGDDNHELARLKKPDLPAIDNLLDNKSPDEILELLRKLGLGG